MSLLPNKDISAFTEENLSKFSLYLMTGSEVTVKSATPDSDGYLVGKDTQGWAPQQLAYDCEQKGSNMS